MTGEGRVPFAGLDRQHAAIETELKRTLDRVIGRSAFILGEEVEAFEAEFAAYCGVGARDRGGHSAPRRPTWR